MKFVVFLILNLVWLPLNAEAKATNNYSIYSKHPLATAAGKNILRQGGNAYDAAVAISAVLTVVDPINSGISAGGQWYLYDSKNLTNTIINDQFSTDKISNNQISAIPGKPAAYDWLARRKGLLPLSSTLQPAIDHARNGFRINSNYQQLLKNNFKKISNSEYVKKYLLKNNNIPKIGSIIKQPELAYTLQQLANVGQKGFYKGEIAQRLINGVKKEGVIWTMEELANYKIKPYKVTVDETVPSLFKSSEESIDLKLSNDISKPKITNINVQPENNDIKTTHFSVTDKNANSVSTMLFDLPFSSVFVPKGTGVFLFNDTKSFLTKNEYSE